MPKLERWEEKAIGRVNRFENDTYEFITTKLTNGLKFVGNPLMKGLLSIAAPIVGGFFKVAPPVEIKGKKFREDIGLVQQAGLKVGAAATNAAFTKADGAVDGYFTRKYFYPSGNTVAETLFSGRVTFDKQMADEMFMACGYDPDFKAILNGMYITAGNVDNSMTDITWRKRITPHIIRTAYQEELKRCLNAIRSQHESRSSPIYNRNLMEIQMNAAARHLGAIFEKFTLDLANNTDFLEAPLSLFPKAPANHDDVPMTEFETALLKDVSRRSLFPNENALQKQISVASKKLPKMTSQQLLERFRNSLDKPVVLPDDTEEPFVRGKNPAEDNRRLITSILNLRELKQQHEKRNFFSRYLTRVGREERAALWEMQNYMHEKLGVSAESVASLLDLKTPLEENLAVSDVLNVSPIQAPEPESFLKNVAGAMSEISSGTVNIISYSTEPLISSVEPVITGAKTLVSGTGKILYNIGAAVLSGASKILSKTTDASKQEPVQENSVPKEPEQNKPAEEEQEQKEQAEQKVEQKPEEKEREVPKDPEPQKEQPSDVWETMKYAASFLNPFSYFSSKQANPPEQPQNKEVPPPEPAQNQQVLSTEQVPNKQDAPTEQAERTQTVPTEQAESTQTVPAEQAESTQTVPTEQAESTQTVPTEQAESTQTVPAEQVEDTPDDPLLAQVQSKQREAAAQLKGKELTHSNFYPTVATLLYYKTLEVSLKKGDLTKEELATSLLKENVESGVNKIAKDPTLKKLDKLNPSKKSRGDKSLMSYYRDFLDQASKDSSAVNELHKEYVKKLPNPTAQSNPKAAEPPVKAPPAKDPPAPGPSIPGGS